MLKHPIPGYERQHHVEAQFLLASKELKKAERKARKLYPEHKWDLSKVDAFLRRLGNSLGLGLAAGAFRAQTAFVACFEKERVKKPLSDDVQLRRRMLASKGGSSCSDLKKRQARKNVEKARLAGRRKRAASFAEMTLALKIAYQRRQLAKLRYNVNHAPTPELKELREATLRAALLFLSDLERQLPAKRRPISQPSARPAV